MSTLVKHYPWLLDRNYLTLTLFLLLTLSMTHPVVIDMVSVWIQSDTYNHCFLIIPISIYLFYEERDRLSRIKNQTSLLGSFLFLGSALGSVLFQLADIKLFAQLSLIMMIQSLILATLGWQKVRVIWFPIFFLFFCVPAGSELVPVLRDFTAQFSVAALKLSDIPVYLDSRYISIPTGDFFVAEACSGINYLIATITLGVLYAYYQYHTLWRRILFLFLALAVPILANGIRAYGIIMVAHWSDNEYATGVDHIIYGWIWFGVVLLMLFSVGRLFKEKTPPPEPAEDDVEQSHNSLPEAIRWNRMIPMVFGVMLLALPFAINSANTSSVEESLIPALERKGWVKTTSQIDGQFPRSSHQASFQVEINGYPFYIDIFVFKGVEQNQVISSVNASFNKEKWRELEALNYQDNDWYRVKDNSDQHIWLATRYYLRGERVTNPLNLMITDLRQKLSFESKNSHAIVIYSEDRSPEALSSDVNKLYQQIESVLD